MTRVQTLDKAVSISQTVNTFGKGMNITTLCVHVESRFNYYIKAMDCGIVESEFELQSRYNVHFRTNILGKGMNPLILPSIG